MMRLRKRAIGLIILLFIVISATMAFVLEPDTFGNWFNVFYWGITSMEVLIMYSIMQQAHLHQEVEEGLAISLPFKSRLEL